MGKRELRKLEQEQAERHAARRAVYAALYADKRYARMTEHLFALNRACTLAEQVGGVALEQATRRFRRYHRRLQAVERAALVKAGFPNG